MDNDEDHAWYFILLSVSKLWGQRLGFGLKLNQGEINVYESWIRLLLLTSEMERFNDTDVTILGNIHCF